MRLLIVNADDFGLTPGVCRGIAEAYREGIVRSTSMLAVAPAFEVGASLLRSGAAPGIGLGVHLALVGEDPPLLSAREVPSLVTRRGDFRRSWREFLAAAAAGRIDGEDVRRELGAQVERVRGIGVPITHFDSHQHLHLWPVVRGVAIDLARAERVAALRVPDSAERSPKGAAVRRLAPKLRRACAEAGLATPDAFSGLDGAGRLTVDAIEARLAAPEPAGSLEIGCHPGAADDVDRRRYRWDYRWDEELAALRAERTRHAVERHGWTLGTFAELAVGAGSGA